MQTIQYRDDSRTSSAIAYLNGFKVNMGTGTRDHFDSDTSYQGLFACLSEAQRSFLSRRMAIRTYAKNMTILYEKDDSDALYIIKSGKVKVTKREENGKEAVISMLSVGDYFGELALIDAGPRSTDVVAVKKTQVAVLNKEDFLPILTSSPQLALSLMRGIAKRLRNASKKIAYLALKDVYGRIVQLFLELATPKDGDLVIDENLSQQDIANMVGSSREMVSRILKTLVTGGYITIDKKIVTIRKTLPLAW